MLHWEKNAKSKQIRMIWYLVIGDNSSQIKVLEIKVLTSISRFFCTDLLATHCKQKAFINQISKFILSMFSQSDCLIFHRLSKVSERLIKLSKSCGIG